MDNPLTSEPQSSAVEDALHTYPIVEMPRDIAMDVMSRIQIVPPPRPFRLTWSDVILALVLSLCIGAIWFSIYNIPPLVVAQIRRETMLFYQYLLVNGRWFIPLVYFALAGILSAFALPYLKQEVMKKSA